MIAVTAATPSVDGATTIGKLDRPWAQDEPVFVAVQPSGPEEAFASLDDAISGAAYMAHTGKVGSNAYSDRLGTFAIVRDGDAFRAAKLLVPVWKHETFGTERIVGAALLRSDNPRITTSGALALDSEKVTRSRYSSYSNDRHDIQGTLRLGADAGGVLAVVGDGWVFQDGALRDVDATNDPFPPPPPPPPPPALGPKLAEAIDLIEQSIAKIETVPVDDHGDAATKDARIAAYKLNMNAQNVLENEFLRDDRSDTQVSELRRADAFLEDANWQLAKKPSPDGRFNGVDIPGALRDSRQAIDVLKQLATSETEPPA